LDIVKDPLAAVTASAIERAMDSVWKLLAEVGA